MVKKKPGKWFEDENIQRITVKGKKYVLGKKEKANLVIPVKKKRKSKDTQLVGQKKKNTVRATKLQCKKCTILSRAK